MITAKATYNLIDQYLPNTPESIKAKLFEYYQLIEQENQKYNLTGFYNEKLFLNGIIESIKIFKEIQARICNLSSKEILDIGSGAGFPIIPYFIYQQDFNLTIYEPLKKRVDFLNLVIKQLDLKNVVIKKIRAEDSLELEKFDFISARAVSELKNLIEISHHLLKINGIACFLKSNSYQIEIANAKWIMKELDIQESVLDLNTFFEIHNVLVFYSKTKKTPKKFPRKWSQIIKK
ncbi:16S rRNA (guanine(527)-N(7))-methyltransferase RsmG [[Mycoplasma] anseris]|uniref:Ribosomal RNA small subunit methyltransferase G n=1 Tax=[Mycoplasma] anseris TaxID=92400 RepID=A0A2Z4NDF4_9BACT|nr:16S rRNA (guanine(527)-N(7))-methyltransferase RsmG [[Mycoplasma] anseris]AWX69624.1 16S rRNA (guanine(527)-N(7))-methyltransferase RsmG [[Mycoplasma] anseris]